MNRRDEREKECRERGVGVAGETLERGGWVGYSWWTTTYGYCDSYDV